MNRPVIVVLSLCLLNAVNVTHSVFASPAANKSTTNKTASPSRPGVAVLAQIIQAYGGAEAIKSRRAGGLRSRVSLANRNGTSDAGNTFDCTVLEKGDFVRVETSLLGVPYIVGFDGKNAWQTNGDWTGPAPSSITSVFADEQKHGLMALPELAKPGAAVELLPARNQLVNGKRCLALKTTSIDGAITIYFVDQQTHLIHRVEFESIDPEMGIKTTHRLDLEDYRPAAGTVEPYKISHYCGTRLRGLTTFKSIEATPLSDEIFKAPPYSEVARLKQGPVSLPFEYKNNELVVKVRINSGEELKFILDTGASQSVVDKAISAKLGAQPHSTFSILSGSKSVPLNYTRLPSLSLGEITFYDVPVLVADLSAVGQKPAGIFGANLLRRFLVTIDYDHKKITFADPESVTVPQDAVVLEVQPVFDGSALMVKAQLDNRKTTHFLVDTGASFNNLPQTLARPFYEKQLLPVGDIYGLDGQKMSIGSLKVNNIKLGDMTVFRPVFTVAPDNNPSHSGLFTSSYMGILGNPIWSQFKTTIDYRNSRLILEKRLAPNKTDRYVELIEQADRTHLKNKNVDEALTVYEKLLACAQVDRQKSAEALVASRIANCYCEKFAATKETKWLEMSEHQFEKAAKLARQAGDSNTEGQILGQWALMRLNLPRSLENISTAQGLLTQALQKAPMDGEIYAAFGTTLLRVGKKADAEKLLDHALVLDPSNWSALWSKYKLYQQESKHKEMALVAEQLQHYYADCPEVIALGHAKAAVQKMDAKATARTDSRATGGRHP